MHPSDRHLSLDAFAIRISVTGLSAIVSAVVVLALLVTPAHRGGGPVLLRYIGPILENIGIYIDGQKLTGQSPLVDYDANTPLQPRFVVRFENNPDAEQSLRLFRENRARGREAFANWANSTETFKGFRLATLTPSGEAVLALDEELSVADPQTTLLQFSTRLSNAPGVSYADPYPFYPDAEKKS